jgi:hypothetical protein
MTTFDTEGIDVQRTPQPKRALQITTDNISALSLEIEGAEYKQWRAGRSLEQRLTIPTDVRPAAPGDWLVTDGKTVWVYPAPVFAAEYEQVAERGDVIPAPAKKTPAKKAAAKEQA